MPFQELELFSPQLALKPQVVVINKADLPEVQTRLQEEKLLEKVSGYCGCHYNCGWCGDSIASIPTFAAHSFFNEICFGSLLYHTLQHNRCEPRQATAESW